MIRAHPSVDCHCFIVICWSSWKSPVKSQTCFSRLFYWELKTVTCTLNSLFCSLSISSNLGIISCLCLVHDWIVCHFDEALANTHYFGCKTQKVDSPTLLSGMKLFTKAYSSFKLHRIYFFWNVIYSQYLQNIFFLVQRLI